jgi:hypothetical protein
MPVPCTPNNSAAVAILNSCAAAFPANSTDCNHFLKASLGKFLVAGYLDGLDADQIVQKMQAGIGGWANSRQIADAIAMAKGGNLVVAGMTSASLGQSHGHVAVVVGCDGQLSGAVAVPMGYAGSLVAAARLNGGRLSGTFAARLVRSEGLDYYFKAPDQVPV